MIDILYYILLLDTFHKHTVSESDANPEKINIELERENLKCPETSHEMDLGNKYTQCISLNKSSYLNNPINPDEITIDEL